MQISNINSLNIQIYNNIREKILPEEDLPVVQPQNQSIEHENYQLPPFYVYDKYSEKSKSKKKILWSSEKIMEMTELALSMFSDLIYKNDVSIKNINKILFDILPNEIASNIKYLDYNKDFANFIKQKNGFSDEQTSLFLKCYKAYVSGDNNGRTLIFLPLDDVYKSNYDRAMFKNYFAHELKHALTSIATEIEQNDLIAIGNDKLTSKYSDFFKSLEQAYDFGFEDNNSKLVYTDFTKENLITNLTNLQTGQTFKNEDEFIVDFEDELIFLLNEKGLTRETLKSKPFLDYITHYARDEKEAYTFQKVLRELNEDKTKTIKIELRVLKYEFFEKYFRIKSAQLNSKV